MTCQKNAPQESTVQIDKIFEASPNMNKYKHKLKSKRTCNTTYKNIIKNEIINYQYYKFSKKTYFVAF